MKPVILQFKPIIFLSLFIVRPLWADNTVPHSSTTFSLAEALSHAQEHNPELVAARLKWIAAKQRIAQARALESPQIMFERMYAPTGDNPFSEANEKNILLSQELPFPGKLSARVRVAQREVDMAYANYEAKQKEITAQVKKAYSALYFNFHSLHIYEGTVDVLRQVANIVQSKYSVGKASQKDALKAQVELSRMLNMLVMIEQELETSRAMLSTTMGEDPSLFQGNPEELSTSLTAMDGPTLTDRALNERPELTAAMSDVQRAQAQIEVSKRELWPDVMLEYRKRTMSEAASTQDANVGFSLPIWFWKQKAMIEESKAEKAMAQAELSAMRNMTRFEVKNLIAKVQTSHRLVELYSSSVIPQAEQALRVAEAAYRSDKADVLDLLDAVRTLLDFRLEHYGHIAEFHALKAELEKVVGGELEGEKP